MEEKIKELLKESAESKKTVMEAWILFLVAAFVLVGVLFRKQIQKWFKDKKETPEPQPEEPEEEEEKEPIEEQPEPVEPEEPTEDNPSDPIEEPELPPVEHPEEPDEKEEKPIPIPEPEPKEPLEPTEESPVVSEILFGTSIHLKWLPKGELFSVYKLKSGSYILADTTAHSMKNNEFIDYDRKEGDEVKYQIRGSEGIIGTIDVSVPESSETSLKPAPMPAPGELPNSKIFNIKEGSEKDETVSVQKQIAETPNGTTDKYSELRFGSDIWLEGDMDNNPRGYKGILNLTGRGFLILADGSFFTKAPAVPFGMSVNKNEHSKRKSFQLNKSTNIISKYLKWTGANTIRGKTIGSTPELTPEWWKGDTNDTGAIRDAGVWEEGWEQEHSFSAEESTNIRYEKCHSYGAFGDGFYAKKVKNLELYDCTVDMAGRQSYGFSDGCYNIKMIGCRADNPRRAALDFECDSGGVIDNVEVAHCYLDSHISAHGHGEVSNIYIHHTKHRSSVNVKGEEGEGRKNWRFEDNEMIAGFGSPTYASKFEHIHNVSYQRNKAFIHDSQNRLALLFKNCSGKLEIIDNDWTNPSIVMVKDPAEDAEIVFEGNTEGSVLVIERGGEKEIIGDNLELLKIIEEKL